MWLGLRVLLLIEDDTTVLTFFIILLFVAYSAAGLAALEPRRSVPGQLVQWLCTGWGAREALLQGPLKILGALLILPFTASVIAAQIWLRTISFIVWLAEGTNHLLEESEGVELEELRSSCEELKALLQRERHDHAVEVGQLLARLRDQELRGLRQEIREQEPQSPPIRGRSRSRTRAKREIEIAMRWVAISENNQEVIDLAMRHWREPEEAAKNIVRSAYKRGSEDNLTVMVVQFGWADKSAAKYLGGKTGGAGGSMDAGAIRNAAKAADDMDMRGQIAIDRIVALRSSVLPIYVIIRSEGVTTADEVSEDGNDFLTTRMFGDQIAFQSIRGDYLSTEGGEICTRRYCSTNERFTVEKQVPLQ
eukprot:g9589.t1